MMRLSITILWFTLLNINYLLGNVKSTKNLHSAYYINIDNNVDEINVAAVNFYSYTYLECHSNSSKEFDFNKEQNKLTGGVDVLIKGVHHHLEKLFNHLKSIYYIVDICISFLFFFK
jgi:hypothetical protein